MVIAIFALTFLFVQPSSFGQGKAASTPGKTIIILDASGSMWGDIQGRPKIEIAREVISDLMGKLSPDLELGLMAYGHRYKGDCEDIELLIPPMKVDRKQFISKVNGILPKGKTPLTAAVERAANFLKYEEEAANVILVSDGLETCDRDPCALAKSLAEKGIKFKAHIVAFDLTSKEADSFRCLADETGGQFLQARDASTLKDALEMAVEAVSEPQAAAEMPVEKLDPAIVTGPESVEAGSEFIAKWTGPNNKNDYICIVPKAADERTYGNYVYTRKGSPITITAPITIGAHELRYIAGKSSKILGRADIEVSKALVTLKAPEEAIAGAEFPVEWTGPDNKGDYITVVPVGTEEREYGNYSYVRRSVEGVLKVTAPVKPGMVEIRYVAGQKSKVLARIPIKILPAAATLKIPKEVVAGAEFKVEWTGPNNKGDYIDAVTEGTPAKKYGGYAYTKNSSEGIAKVSAPLKPGPAIVRYMTGQDQKILAELSFIVIKAKVTLSPPAEAPAGSIIKIAWTGPDNKLDYISIAEVDTRASKNIAYSYTKRSKEGIAEVQAPEITGDYEIRYVTGGKATVLAMQGIKITEVTAKLSVAAKIDAEAAFTVNFRGPQYRNYYVAIFPKGSDNKRNKGYFYVYKAKEFSGKLKAPKESGAYEIRYLTRSRKALATAPFQVVPTGTAGDMTPPELKP